MTIVEIEVKRDTSEIFSFTFENDEIRKNTFLKTLREKLIDQNIFVEGDWILKNVINKYKMDRGVVMPIATSIKIIDFDKSLNNYNLSTFDKIEIVIYENTIDKMS